MLKLIRKQEALKGVFVLSAYYDALYSGASVARIAALVVCGGTKTKETPTGCGGADLF